MYKKKVTARLPDPKNAITKLKGMHVGADVHACPCVSYLAHTSRTHTHIFPMTVSETASQILEYTLFAYMSTSVVRDLFQMLVFSTLTQFLSDFWNWPDLIMYASFLCGFALHLHQGPPDEVLRPLLYFVYLLLILFLFCFGACLTHVQLDYLRIWLAIRFRLQGVCMIYSVFKLQLNTYIYMYVYIRTHMYIHAYTYTSIYVCIHV